MKVRLHATDIVDNKIEHHYPAGFHDNTKAITERVHRADPWLGQGDYRELFFEGMHIGYGHLAPRKNTLINFESDFESVEMHFALGGQVQTTDLHTKKQYNFSQNEHNILYAAGFKGRSTWATNPRMEVFEVNVMPSLFKKYLPEHVAFEEFRKSLTQQRTSLLVDRNRPISARMRMIIHEIMHCERTGPLKKMLVEARVIELLLLQLEQIIADQNTHHQASSNYLKKADIDRMYAVREIIETNVNTPHSLGALAKQVGTNEFTLKKGFKSLFGTTVFGYLLERKMVQAREMLLEEKDKTITEVSEQCGYQYASHFTTAFKRRFGVPPSQLRRGVLSAK
ncbi:helix-turn-helix transcriptional regulator [Tunicatimonas pelagia]|uniref:helix-turn-helix transcriptional regulator n=1 Tax=Tunicatimonas pelagia TaxID=931531 RepID=UPI0026666C4F|nr:AraC family transcriptional regulator [Tunicatimonas pelagia]WKN42964.1 AraC family transcriptional regulator [Tunicatimonas pelagia]